MTKHSDILLEKKARGLFAERIAITTNTDAAQLKEVTDLMGLVHYKKNQIVINEGQIADYFYFIIKGLVKVYFFKNDKVVVERFEQEGGLFGGNFTHISSNMPGKYVYETLENTTMLKIKYSDLDDLCKRSHTVERAYRIMMEAFHNSYVERLYFFKSLNSEERYQAFSAQHGDILNRAPLKDIANYLGMTPETLSRIRAK